MMDTVIQPEYLALIPIIVAFVQAIKHSELIPNRYLPLLAITAGMIFGFFIEVEPIKAIILGGSLGLSAIGAHSGIKNSLKK